MTTYPDSDTALRDAATRILKEHPGGMLLSRLGQELSRDLGDKFRDYVEPGSLKRSLQRSLRESVRWEGEGPNTFVSLGAEATRLVFDRRFWSGFAKPIKPNCRRWISVSRPYRFWDVEDAAAAPPRGTVEILSDYIVDPSMERRERSPLIAESIAKWCAQQALSPQSFRTADDAAPFRKNVHPERQPHKGIEALEKLVAAVPVEERTKFSIPFDLLERLLRQD